MPFSSLNFIAILPVLLLVYWSLPERFKRGWLLISSLIVYMAAGWEDLLLQFTVTTVNWTVSRLRPASKRLPVAMIVFDVLCLAWFKYRIFLELVVTRCDIMRVINPCAGTNDRSLPTPRYFQPPLEAAGATFTGPVWQVGRRGPRQSALRQRGAVDPEDRGALAGFAPRLWRLEEHSSPLLPLAG